MSRRFTKLSDRTVDVATCLLALWTVCCNATVFCGGDGRALVVTASVVFALAAIGLLWRSRRLAAQPPVADGATAAAPDRATAAPAQPHVVSVIGFVLALGVCALWDQTRDGLWVWSASCAFFVGGTAWMLFRGPKSAAVVVAAVPTVRDEALLWLLASIGAVTTLFLHLPNTDDVVYVNLAVALADHPEFQLYAHDTIHDIDGALLPAYSVHSFELLGGVLSLVTRVPALLVIHLGLATIAGLLTPLAWARLFRLLDPGRWLWMVAIVVSMYLFDGSEIRSFAMHGFVRMFQGKAILLSVGVPIISANALAFAHAPSRRALLLLAASVISGVGLSSTGLWLGPFVAGTSLLVAVAPRLASLAVVGFGLLSCAYPVALGLWVRALMAAKRAAKATASGAGVAEPSAASTNLGDSFATIGQAIAVTFGGKQVAAAYLACMLLGWPLARTELAKRYMLVFGSIGTALLLNPYLIEFLQANVTGNGTYSRVLWYLPVPVAFALCFASTIPSDGSRRGKLAAAAVSCVALAAFCFVVPKQTVFAAGDFALSLRPKVDRPSYALAQYLTRILPARSRVLAPRDVSLHLPLLQQHPFPVMTKASLIKRRERDPRLQMRKVVDGEHKPMDAKRRAWFVAGLNRYHVDAVVLAPEATAQGLASALEGARFSLVHRLQGYRVWTRPRSAQRER